MRRDEQDQTTEQRVQTIDQTRMRNAMETAGTPDAEDRSLSKKRHEARGRVYFSVYFLFHGLDDIPGLRPQREVGRGRWRAAPTAPSSTGQPPRGSKSSGHYPSFARSISTTTAPQAYGEKVCIPSLTLCRPLRAQTATAAIDGKANVIVLCRAVPVREQAMNAFTRIGRARKL